MPRTDSDLHETIGLIYDSALDPKVWPAALKAMCWHVDALQGSISVLDTARREIRFSSDWTDDPEWPRWRRLLDEKYGAMMPFFDVMPRFDVGDVYNTAQLAARAGLDDYYEMPFFKEWALPSGRRDTLGSIVMKSADRFGVFALHTSTKRDLVGQRELAIGKLLVPHVRRAVTIGDLLNMVTATARTLQATLDKLNSAVVVTDAHARILLTNSAAEAMLRAGEPIAIEDGQLRAGQPRATKALRTAIGQTLEGLGTAGIGVPLRHRDGAPAVAHVLPLGHGPQHRDWDVPRAAAAVFVAPVNHAPPPAEALAALFGLTVMEARVVEQIAAGRNRAEAAATLGIADNTAKSHLDRIFGKTNTKTQGELAQLIAALASPAR
jgi:DNA-binding CsgD family transcriptional regulator